MESFTRYLILGVFYLFSVPILANQNYLECKLFGGDQILTSVKADLDARVFMQSGLYSYYHELNGEKVRVIEMITMETPNPSIFRLEFLKTGGGEIVKRALRLDRDFTDKMTFFNEIYLEVSNSRYVVCAKSN